MYALFAADVYRLLAESGIVNSDWVELHDPSFLNGANQPAPGYYGMQKMLHIAAFRPGDEFVTTSSSLATLAVHATHRTDGAFGLVLVNKDSTNSANVKVTISGGTFALQGTRFDYGPDQLTAGTGVAKSSVKVDGPVFTVNVPAYSIVDTILPKSGYLRPGGAEAVDSRTINLGFTMMVVANVFSGLPMRSNRIDAASLPIAFSGCRIVVRLGT
jgi:hypothetical protein